MRFLKYISMGFFFSSIAIAQYSSNIIQIENLKTVSENLITGANLLSQGTYYSTMNLTVVPMSPTSFYSFYNDDYVKYSMMNNKLSADTKDYWKSIVDLRIQCPNTTHYSEPVICFANNNLTLFNEVGRIVKDLGLLKYEYYVKILNALSSPAAKAALQNEVVQLKYEIDKIEYNLWKFRNVFTWSAAWNKIQRVFWVGSDKFAEEMKAAEKNYTKDYDHYLKRYRAATDALTLVNDEFNKNTPNSSLK